MTPASLRSDTPALAMAETMLGMLRNDRSTSPKYAAKELDGQSAGYAYMTEIKSVSTDAPEPGTFDVPAGYKKVGQL